MAPGRVKWWNDEQGYGFITDSSGKDLFVHYSEIEAGGFQKLEDGWSVDFEEIADQRGPMAINIRRPGAVIATKPQKILPKTYIKRFSAPSVRQIQNEANNFSLNSSHKIISLSITRALDGAGYVAAVIYDQPQSEQGYRWRRFFR